MSDAPQRESVASEVSNTIVALLKRNTGRGPVKAKTTLGSDTVLCILQDTLTQGEKTLVEAGHAGRVLSTRHDFQNIMRDEICAAVERLTGRRVISFLSDNGIDPDISAEVFVLEPRGGDDRSDLASADPPA
jgi:uncharacterized protein YbcI